MRRTVLLTLGRLPKALDLARGFCAAGWRVIIAEPHRRHLTGASRHVARSYAVAAPLADPEAYLRDLIAVMAREDVSLVVPVSEETLHAAHLHGRIGSTRLLTMDAAVVHGVHDKSGFVAHAHAAGLTAPESYRAGDPRAAALADQTEVILKPLHGCSGRGVARLPRGQEIPANRDLLVQCLVAGAEVSTCSLAHRGQVLATSVYRATLRSGSVAVGFERIDHPAVSAWAARFIAHLGWTGFIGFDLIVDGSGIPWGIECNPRATSGLHFFEPLDLARAILDPTHTIRFRPEQRLQQFWASLTEARSAAGPARRAAWRQVLTTQDVTFRWDDPLPALTMPWTAWPIIRAARRARVPLGEIAMLDLAQRGHETG